MEIESTFSALAMSNIRLTNAKGASFFLFSFRNNKKMVRRSPKGNLVDAQDPTENNARHGKLKFTEGGRTKQAHLI